MAKKITITSHFEEFDSLNQLNETDKKLLLEAKSALQKAYAPYSNFYVGAAALLENGIIVTGNNQENAAYPSGLCAERVAAFYASSQYPDKKIIAIAVAVKSKNKIINSPVSPCGACRQSLSEYEVKFESPIKIIMSGETGPIYISESVANLLPLKFSGADL
jgi:cytidine deaminase